MSYSQVSHVYHDSYPPQGLGPGPAPPLPPRPTYQGYFERQDYPVLPPAGRMMPFHSYDDYSYDNPCASLFRTCLAAVCCCCLMEECFPLARW